MKRPRAYYVVDGSPSTSPYSGDDDDGDGPFLAECEVNFTRGYANEILINFNSLFDILSS